MRNVLGIAMVAGFAASAYAGDCPGDCNGDGMASVLDFVCFQGEWTNQTPAGDCNGDGNYSVLDFVCFQGEWVDFQNGGCDGGAAIVDEDFDDYNLGSVCGQGPWEAWDLNPDVCAPVSDEQANSGSQSLKLIGTEGAFGDDVVIVLDETGDSYTFSLNTFVPEDAVGQGWIIMLNTYAHQDPNKNWSLQVRLNADLSTVEVDFTGEIALLQKGEWVPFVAEIDLANDSVDYYYGGEQFVFGKSWIDGVSGGGQPRIQCIDMYAGEPGGGGTSGVYYDDILLVEGIN